MTWADIVVAVYFLLLLFVVGIIVGRLLAMLDRHRK